MNTATLIQILLVLIVAKMIMNLRIFTDYIGSKTTQNQKDFLEYWAKIAIQAMEIRYKNTPGQGMVKKAYVIRFLQDRGCKMEDEELAMLVDVLVENLINNPN